MTVIHDKNRLCFSSKAGIDQHTALPCLLSQSLDRRRLGTDNRYDSSGRHGISKANVNQFHKATPIVILFDVLDLLSDLFNFRLDVHHGSRDLDITALGADGIGFTVEFLNQKVKLASHRSALGKHIP